MKKALIALLLVFGIAVIGLGAYAVVFLPEKIKIEAQKAFNGPNQSLQIDKMGLSFFSPVGFKIQKAAIKMSVPESGLDFVLTVPEIELGVSWKKIKFGLLQPVIEIKKKVTATQAKAVEQASQPVSKTPPNSSAPMDLSAVSKLAGWAVDLKIDHGSVSFNQGEQNVQITDLIFEIASHDPLGEWKIDSKMKLFAKAEGKEFKIDPEINIRLHDLIQKKIILDEVKAIAFGVPLTLKGDYELMTGKSLIDLKVDIVDFSKLPKFSQAQNGLKGGLFVETRATNSDGKEWTASGKVEAKSISGALAIDMGSQKVNGPIFANGKVEFQYAKTINLPLIQLEADLSSAEVTSEPHFRKASSIPLSLNINSSSNGQTLDIKSLLFKIDQISVSGNGQVASVAGQKSELHFKIPKTDLKGIERNFPAISKTPMRGTLELTADIVGDLQKPESLTLSLAPLHVRSLSTQLDWMSADKKTQIAGPVFVDAAVNLVAHGTDLKRADLSIQGDLSKLSIASEGTFKKASGARLSLDLEAKQLGQKIAIKRASATLLSNQIILNGQISQPQQPQFNLEVKIPKLNYSELAQVLPALAASKLSGTGTGSIKAQGTYDFKGGIEKSPILLVGSYQTQVGRIKLTPPPTATASAKKKDEPVKAVPPPTEPLLPNWPILNRANLSLKIDISGVDYGNTPIEQIKLASSLNQGILSGSASIGQIFSGNIRAPRFDMNLKELQPDVHSNVEFSKINVGKMVTDFSPAWKDSVKGIASGKTSLLIPHSSRSDFLDRVAAIGNAELTDAYFSSIQIDEIVQEKLSKIPKLSSKAHVGSKGLAGNMSITFNLAHQKMTIDPFHFISPEKNELAMKGWLKLDQSVDLAGTAYLAKSPISGVIHKANSDANGRLVLPLEIKGNLSNPEVGFAEATIQALLTNTAKYEANQKLEEAKTKAKAAASQAVTNAVKGAAGDAASNAVKKGLGGLFKK